MPHDVIQINVFLGEFLMHSLVFHLSLNLVPGKFDGVMRVLVVVVVEGLRVEILKHFIVVLRSAFVLKPRSVPEVVHLPKIVA